MKVFISRDKKAVIELKQVEELHVSKWKNVVITYLNFETKPFSKCFAPEEWDTIIINKKAL